MWQKILKIRNFIVRFWEGKHTKHNLLYHWHSLILRLHNLLFVPIQEKAKTLAMLIYFKKLNILQTLPVNVQYNRKQVHRM